MQGQTLKCSPQRTARLHPCLRSSRLLSLCFRKQSASQVVDEVHPSDSDHLQKTTVDRGCCEGQTCVWSILVTQGKSIVQSILYVKYMNASIFMGIQEHKLFCDLPKDPPFRFMFFFSGCRPSTRLLSYMPDTLRACLHRMSDGQGVYCGARCQSGSCANVSQALTPSPWAMTFH